MADRTTQSGRRKLLKGGVALAAGAFGAGFSIIGKASAAPITLRFGSDSPLNASHTTSAMVMKKILESRTQGRIRVMIYPDGQLGGNGSMVNSVKAGTLDAVVSPNTTLSPAVPEIDVFCLPLLYQDAAHTLRIARGPLGMKLVPKINQAFNCEVVGFTTDGVIEMISKTQPVRCPQDMVGLKVGVGTSRIQRDTVLALGGIPTVMDITSNYMSLRTGLINSTAKSRMDVIELKLYMVTKYLTLANLYSIPNLLLVSRRFLDRLSPQDRALIHEAGLVACDAQRDATYATYDSSLKFLTSHGVQTVQVDSIAAFRDKLNPVFRMTADRIGADIVSEARRQATA